MKRPAVFITYFQSIGQIVHVYKVSWSGYFFQKFYGRFNLMSMFFTFHHFYEKTYEKTYWFFDLFWNFLSLYVGWQKFFNWNFLPKNGGSLKMLSIYYLFLQLWATFAKKVMKRPTFFFQYFQTSTFPLSVHKISWPASYKKKYAVCFNMWTKTCLLQQLWTIFSTKIM